MKVLVTGATGFVGRWLIRELEANADVVVPAPASAEFDIADPEAVGRLVRHADPEAIAHLAGVSYGGDARRDPWQAFRVNVLGTSVLLDAVSALPRSPAVLVAGSAEAYARPRGEHVPLDESAPLVPSSPYGLSKLAQEAVALELARRDGLRLVVTRAFNHIGPGQRSEFVVPALVARIRDVVNGAAHAVPIGNADVRRDFTDVRDVVRAYRLLLKASVAGALPAAQMVVNVASGRSTSIRSIAERLLQAAGCEADLVVDPALVRSGEPVEIVGDARLIQELVGWRQTIPLEQTLGDIVAAGLGADSGHPH